MTPHAPEATLRAPRAAERLGTVGAVCAILAGSVEILVGAHIRPWIGDKADPARLGVVAVALGAVAVAAAATLRRSGAERPTRRAAAAALLLITGTVGTTTTGRLWYVPAALLVSAGAVAAWSVRHDARRIALDAERHLPAVLTVILAVTYLLFGLTALGTAGIAGIAAGALVLGFAAVRPPWSTRRRALVLILLVVPFAALTWWSVVTPLTAVLLVLFGTAATARPPRPAGVRPDRWVSRRCAPAVRTRAVPCGPAGGPNRP